MTYSPRTTELRADMVECPDKTGIDLMNDVLICPFIHYACIGTNQVSRYVVVFLCFCSYIILCQAAIKKILSFYPYHPIQKLCECIQQVRTLCLTHNNEEVDYAVAETAAGWGLARAQSLSGWGES